MSRPPYDANNLAGHVGDDPAAVAANRSRLAAALGVPAVAFMAQVHGTDVAAVTAVPAASGEVATADALVTGVPGLAIAVLVADCVPITLTTARAVGVVHAGRRGVVSGVVAAAVDALRRLDDGPVMATIGPSICGRCYEVPAEMQAEVVAVVPAASSMTRAGTPALDLPAAVRAQLASLGVEVAEQPSPCTLEDRRFYSYRRDGATGRFAMVAMLAP